MIWVFILAILCFGCAIILSLEEEKPSKTLLCIQGGALVVIIIFFALYLSFTKGGI